MKMPSNSDLRRLRDERIRSLQRHLLEEKLDNVKEDLEWISVIDQAIVKAKPHHSIKWSLIIGSLCLILVTISLLIRMPEVNFKGTFLVQRVNSTVSSNWESSHPIAFRMVDITNLSKLEGPELNLRTQPSGTFGLRIQSENPIYLNNLMLKQNSKVSIIRKSENIELLVRDDSISGELMFKGETFISVTGDTILEQKTSSSEYNTVNIFSRKVIKDPIGIIFDRVEDWNLNRLQSSEISFDEEIISSDNVIELQSSVIKGDISVLETGKKLVFDAGDIVVFQDVVSRRMNIFPDSTAIKVLVEGKASTLRGGPKGFVSNLKPTLAEYLFHQQKVAFFYSSFIFLWGVFWSVRNFFFQKT